MTLPLGSTAPVIPAGTGIPLFDAGAVNAGAMQVNAGNPGNFSLAGNRAGPGPMPAVWDTTSLQVDLATATGATINAIRQAFQIQRLLERDARGGTRYTEIVRSHFGVVSPDARLQRPEYLGGGSSPLIVSQVPQTSATDAGTPQGNLAAVS